LKTRRCKDDLERLGGTGQTRTKKELNTVITKVTILQKKLEASNNVVTKPRRKFEDNDEEDNALEREIEDVDMQFLLEI
jgi:hypothetical protein